MRHSTRRRDGPRQQRCYTKVGYNGSPFNFFSNFVAVVGISDSSVREQLEVISQIAVENGCTGSIVMTEKNECVQLWRKRKEAIWATMGLYPDREPMVTDACVPLSGLPELISMSRQWLDESGLPSPILAHAGKIFKRSVTS